MVSKGKVSEGVVPASGVGHRVQAFMPSCHEFMPP
jgi:hypothetical protein